MKYQNKYTLEEILVKHSPVNRTVLKRYLQKFNVIPYVCAICGNDGHWNEKQLSLQIDHINGVNDDNRKENLRWLCPNCHSQTDTFSGRNVKKDALKNIFTDEEAIKALQETANVNQAMIKLGSKNWLKVNKIKQANGIVQSDDIKDITINVSQYHCSVCGRPITKDVPMCQTCLHELQRVCEWPDRDTLKNLIRTKPFTKIGLKYKVSDNAVRKWCIHYGLPSKKKDIQQYSDEEWINL